MLPEIIEYDGLLSFDTLPDERLAVARGLVEDSGLQIELGPQHLELAYAGRDARRKVVQLMRGLARIVGDARGEVICTLDREGADPEFEFYSIADGKLWRQKGRIVRAQSEVVRELEAPQVA